MKPTLKQIKAAAAATRKGRVQRVVGMHHCKCKGYNGGQCYNCLNGAHHICDSKPKCRVKKSKHMGLMVVCK